MFKKLPFYNVLIKKPYTKRLNNIRKLPFYDELGIVKTSRKFRGYARSYRIERIHSKDPSVQFTSSKLGIGDLFEDLLAKIKCFKYQIIAKVLLSKYKENADREFAYVYFNSATKTVINSKYDLDGSFQEILHRIDNWIRNTWFDN